MKYETNDMIKELIPRYLSGEVSAEEKKQLQDWIEASAENKKIFTNAKRIFDTSREYFRQKTVVDQNLDINLDQEWNHFLSHISNNADTPVRSIRKAASSSVVWYKIAAAVLLVLASAFVINLFFSKPKDFLFKTAENTTVVSLPDGSVVTLNRHSELHYSASFGDLERTVVLTGEAFFDVKRDTEKPFVISANGTTVEVLGTSFNVRAYHNNAVEVVVKTGRVKFSAPGQGNEVKLEEGQRGVYDSLAKRLNQDINDDVNFQSWNTKQIIFEETDLRRVVETLEKAYGVRITLAGEIPASCAVTVTFDHQTIEAVLHVLETTLNLTYTIQGSKIEITNIGC